MYRVSGVFWLTLVAKFVVDCDCRCVAFSVELTWELGAWPVPDVGGGIRVEYGEIGIGA